MSMSMSYRTYRSLFNVGEIMRDAEQKHKPGHLVEIITEWSESCTCGASFHGYEEEPFHRPNCTGYYPVDGWRFVAGAGGDWTTS